MQQHIFQINEIFESIEGETTFSGFPSLFIRFTGCNLRCNYCDTKYAYSEGKFYSTEQIIELIKGSNKKYIIITGGEPLIQKGIEHLIMEIGKTDKIIIIETNGSMPIDNILGNSTIVMMDIIWKNKERGI
jgi:7-carboxy-7-deazaguanine synthase